MNKTFLVKIVEGKINFQSEFNEARFRDFAKLNEGKILTLKKYELIRSLSQNALYWVYLSKIEMETGNTAEDMHEYFKAKLLPRRLLKIRGKAGFHEVEVLGSTTLLKKHEFGAYLDKCAEHCGIPLPTIQEQEEMGYLPR